MIVLLLPDEVADCLADGDHGRLQVGHGVAVLALLVQDDQLAHLHTRSWSPGHKETPHLLGHGLQNVGDGFCLIERHFVIRTWGGHLLLTLSICSIVQGQMGTFIR